jgi:hypothetical protein
MFEVGKRYRIKMWETTTEGAGTGEYTTQQ